MLQEAIPVKAYDSQTGKGKVERGQMIVKLKKEREE